MTRRPLAYLAFLQPEIYFPGCGDWTEVYPTKRAAIRAARAFYRSLDGSDQLEPQIQVVAIYRDDWENIDWEATP